MKTFCRKCCFAEWDGDKQVGCRFNNRLDIFKQRKEAELIEKDDKTFYQINRFCNACIIEDTPIEDVENFIRPKIDYIIVLGENETEEQLFSRVSEVICSDILPENLYIVVNNDIPVKDLYIKYFNIVKDYDIKIIVTCPMVDFDDGTCFNMTANKCKGQYIAIFQCSHPIPCNLIDIVDNLINYKMEKLLVIKPITEFHGTVISKQMIKLYKTDLNINVMIEDIENNNPELVQQWK